MEQVSCSNTDHSHSCCYSHLPQHAQRVTADGSLQSGHLSRVIAAASLALRWPVDFSSTAHMALMRSCIAPCACAASICCSRNQQSIISNCTAGLWVSYIDRAHICLDI